jgi:hypothetical protein
VHYVVERNVLLPRSGTMTIAGQTITVSQSGLLVQQGVSVKR